mmetsp:Transcript_8544/g.24527  ORF Transcript_8544/g.24527 Transcript_8544/m.24527 type:complete len:480 (-) Transcript_8544:168-1607(-)
MAAMLGAASVLTTCRVAAGGSLHRTPRWSAAGLGIGSSGRRRPAATAAFFSASVAVDGHQEAAGQLLHSSDFAPPSAAYVHLPFCKRKCLYCDFPVQAVGNSNRPGVPDSMDRYVQQVCREIEATSAVAGQKPLKTLFFGGGTPSLISADLLARIIEAIRQRFDIMDGAEISMEVDPGTFTADSLRAYQELGVNRFSVGVQSFQQEILEGIGRSHGINDVREALSILDAVAPPSWSLDLMSGLPHLTMELWRESLQAAVSTGAPHISVYDLQVEEGTPFARMYTPSTSPLPSETLGAEMYGEVSTFLRAAGYEHYELSNYALPGHRCRHNMVYWTGESFHAFGLGAASYIGGRRFSRPRKMLQYYAWIDEYAESGSGVPGEGVLPPDSPEEQLLDTIMLRLRLRDGLHLSDVSRRFGSETGSLLAGCLQKYADQGLVQVLPERSSRVLLDHNSSVCLTDPEGLLLSNEIMADLFAVAGD